MSATCSVGCSRNAEQSCVTVMVPSSAAGLGQAQAKEFLGEIDGLATQFDIFRLLKRVCTLFGFTSFMVLRLPDMSDKLISDCAIITNWPPEMITRYDELGLLRTSPLMEMARRTIRPIILPLSVRTAGSPVDEKGVSDALFRDFSFLLGLAIPVHDCKGERALVSFEGDRGELTHGELTELTTLSIHIYDRMLTIEQSDGVQGTPLNERERDCLEWTADGKTSGEIAAIVGLSEHTVNHYLTRATRKLGSVNRTQAVAKAIRRGWIG